jgi:hypothetical protein
MILRNIADVHYIVASGDYNVLDSSLAEKKILLEKILRELMGFIRTLL